MPPMDEPEKISTKLEVLIESVRNLTSLVASNHSEVKGILADHEERLRVLELSNAEIKSRMTTFQMLQAAYTTIGTVIATILGKTP